MKKIFTLIAATCIGALGLMARPLPMEQLRTLTPEMSPEGMKSITSDFANIHMGLIPEGEAETMTRTWTDSRGNKWGLVMVMNEQTLADVLLFPDDKGNPIHLPFEEVPFYYVEAYFTYTPANAQMATRSLDLVLAWPSMYFFQPEDTPDDEIDWSAIGLSDFCNSDMVRLFEQTGYLMNYSENNKFVSWAIIPGPSATYDNQEYDVEDGSSVQFYSFSSEDLWIEADLNANLVAQSGAKAVMSCKYRGAANRVLGFEPTSTKLDNFSQVVVYNAGLISDEMLGDDTPFSEPFGEMTALYVLAGGEGFVPGQAQGGGAFARNKVGFAETNPEDDQFNCIQGFMFADPKYAKDTTIDPKECRFNVVVAEWEYDELLEEDYLAVAPEIDAFLQGGYTYTWSVDYGTEVAKQGYYYFPSKESNIAWGTTDGFVANMVDDYKASYFVKSTCTEIVYYYDPTDITKYRTFPAVGSLESFVNPDEVAVKGVKADGFNSKVIARNGKINVVAGEKAPIAVYTLDGKLVKAAKATELSVEAPKGMYIVRVGNQAKKVVL